MLELAPVEGAYFVELPPEQIRPNRAQPRSVFDEDAMVAQAVRAGLSRHPGRGRDLSG